MMEILTLALWLAFGSAQQATGASVEGMVLRTGTNDPIDRVQVTLVLDSATPMRALTDKEGHFSFSGVAPGRYTIKMQRDGYLVPGSTQPDWVATGNKVSVGASEHLKGLTYYLTLGGTISGRILDPSGRPAALAEIQTMRLIYQGGRPALSPVKSTSSNDRGEYRLFWLEPGDYIVRAEKNSPLGPVRAYYAGTASAANSVKVRVSEGTESTKIDIVLQKDQAFRISGTVTNIIASMQNPPGTVPAPTPAAQASQQMQFFLSPTDPDEIYDGVSSWTNVLTSAQDRAAGKFEIRNVRTGLYTLIAIATDRSSGSPRYFVGRTPVEVAFEDVGGLQLLIAPGRDLEGQVVFPANVPQPASLRVQLHPKWQDLPLAESLSAVVQPDGAFAIPNVPDFQYSVSLSGLPRDAYVADLRQGSFSVFDIGTIVPGRRVNDQFEVIVDSPGAKINGRVTMPNAQVVPGAVVALVPDERRQENLLLYKRTTASEAGAFSFTGVAPGRYRLYAGERIPAGAEFNAEFRDTFRDEVREITVAPGDTAVVELRLNPS